MGRVCGVVGVCVCGGGLAGHRIAAFEQRRTSRGCCRAGCVGLCVRTGPAPRQRGSALARRRGLSHMGRVWSRRVGGYVASAAQSRTGKRCVSACVKHARSVVVGLGGIAGLACAPPRTFLARSGLRHGLVVARRQCSRVLAWTCDVGSARGGTRLRVPHACVRSARGGRAHFGPVRCFCQHVVACVADPRSGRAGHSDVGATAGRLEGWPCCGPLVVTGHRSRALALVDGLASG